MVYTIKLEPLRVKDSFTILKIIIENDNIALDSIKNSYVQYIQFDFEGSMSEVRAFLQLINTKADFKLLNIKEKKLNWFQKLFCKENK